MRAIASFDLDKFDAAPPPEGHHTLTLDYEVD
jgi:hypothetical protein